MPIFSQRGLEGPHLLTYWPQRRSCAYTSAIAFFGYTVAETNTDLMALIAAARAGARTVLFERHGFLGGAATAGAVGQFVGWETGAGRRVIAGLAEEIVER